MKELLFQYLFPAIQALTIIIVAPLMMGWVKQVKSWMQNRKAPSVFLPYYSCYKLLIKKPVLAENASWLFRCVPYFYFSFMVIVCMAIPIFTTQTLAFHFIDVVVIVGLMAFARILLALAAMDVGTAFGSLGSRREMFVSCLAEPTLLLVFFNSTLVNHSPYLGQMSAHLIQHAVLHPSLIFSFFALVLIMIAETGRVPIDNPATHLELTMIHESMVLEYSGRYLALIEWSNAIKFTLYLGFIIALFIPTGLSTFWQVSGLLIGVATSLFKLVIIAAIIGVIESINSKLRIFKVPDYLTIAFMLAVLSILISILSAGQFS